MIQTSKKLGEKVPWLVPLVLWVAWACAGYLVVVRALEEIRNVQWQYSNAAVDWIVNDWQFSGHVDLLVTLLLLAGWCAGAYFLYRSTISARRGK